MTFTEDTALLVSLLASMCERLTQATDEGQVAGLVLPAVADSVGARLATLALLSGQRTLRVLSTVGMPETTTTPWVEFDIAAAVPLAACVRNNAPVWLSDVEAARPSFAALPRPTASTSLCAVPLVHDGRVVGALGVGWAERHEFDRAEQQALLSLAGLTAATCAGDRQRQGARDELAVHTHPTPDGVDVACLARPDGARCELRRARPGSPPGPGSLFVSLLDADPALPARTVDAVGGVLALSRRRAVPPALVAEAIADLAEDLDGPVTGAHVEVDVATGWAAVAPLDPSVVILTRDRAAGASTPPATPPPRGERLVLAGREPAVVLVAALDAHVDAAEVRLVQETCRRALGEAEPADRDRADHGGEAARLAARVGELLRLAEVDPRVRGVLVVVVRAPTDLTQRARTMPAAPTSAVLARRFVTAALPEDAGPDLAAEVALVTDELVTNAARHAYPDLRVVVTDQADGVRLAVSDDDDRGPDWLADDVEPSPGGSAAEGSRLPLPGTDAGDPTWPTAESGRGLSIVHALADQVGTSPRPGGGKYVWALLRWRRGPR